MTIEARTAVATRRRWPLLVRLRAPDFQQAIFAVVLVVLLALIAPPVFFLLRGSLSGVRGTTPDVLSLEAYAGILASPHLSATLGATLVFAVLSSCLGIALGSLVAWIVERTDVPFKQLVYAGTFVTFAIPGIVRVVGWIFLLGPRSGYINQAVRTLLRRDDVTFDIFSMP